MQHSPRKVVAFSKADGKKLMILDTSVLLHDPESLFRFKEHDVFLPGPVLVQLDRHKKGQTDVARNARRVTRILDEVFKGDKKLLKGGASLVEASNASATGKLFFQMEKLEFALPRDLLDDDADRRIIGVACALRRERQDQYDKVVLVTKDMNMRFAALRVQNGDIEAEDYLTDRVLLKDSDVLPVGFQVLPKNFWDNLEVLESGKQGRQEFWRVRGPLCRQLSVNDCVYVEDGSLYAKVRKHSGAEMTLERVKDYQHNGNMVWGVRARNKEQSFALNHLTDPEIDLTILLGDAGTGKSLCALAAGFSHLRKTDTAQDHHGISKIILTRAMVPVGGEDLGFLPGDVNDKFGPWMIALEDTKEALFNNAIEFKLWNEAQVEERTKQITIQPISLIAGRTLANSYVIVDEAQNLTPYQAKMLVTRAGSGTKFVFCGNLSQIDTPFLDEKSSGLAYLVMRMKGHERVAHVILQECVRSRLAKLAVEKL